MSPEDCHKRYNKYEHWKTIRLTSFQKTKNAIRFNLLQVCPRHLCFLLYMLCYMYLLLVFWALFFFYRLLSLGAVPMHCLNFDKFRDTTPSKLIKRENLAKAINRTSKLKTTRLCTHIIYEGQRANSTKTFTGKSKQYKLKRFILKWPTFIKRALAVTPRRGWMLNGCSRVRAWTTCDKPE